MSAFFGALGGFSRTFGTTMNAEVQKVAVLHEGAQVRHRRSSSRSTARTFPVSVYTRLIDGVNRNLPSFHRYLKLRQRMMGARLSCTTTISTRRSSSSVKLEYTPEEAQKLVLGAVAPLGPEYAAVIQRAFNDRWIDLLPNDGQALGRVFERRRATTSTRTC